MIRDVTQEHQVQKRIQQQERLAAVGQLAAGIAHDFNNLLTGIIGFADILQNTPRMTARERTMLGHIVTQGERGAHLVRQILDFSRLSISQLQPLDLASFLKDSIRFLERTIPENIRMILELDADAHLVYADATRLDQVLTNLVINARDAMPSGGELRLSLSHFTLERHAPPPCPDMPAGKWELLSVSDTGTGIAPDDLSRIYEPFFTTKTPGKGSGLGLAQVYGIISVHNGYIRAESQEGRGTTILMYLPALEARPNTSIDAGVSNHEDIPRGSGETVLLVEDESRVLEVCTLILEELGYHVLTASDGQQGLDVYTRHQSTIDVVLMDMVMPGMGGVDLFKALQALNPSVKAVMMTGYPLGEHSKQLLAQGILDWVLKPLSTSRLARIMRRVLRS